MKRVLPTILLVASAMATAQAVAPQYWIKPGITADGGQGLSLAIKTNLPDGALVTYSLDKAGQKPSDVYIGIPQGKRFAVSHGAAHIVISLSKGVMPDGGQLPAGKYDLTVTYGAGWPENRHFHIYGAISGKTSVNINNVSRENIDYNLQRWAMAHFNGNSAWDLKKMTLKFGTVIDYPVQGNSEMVETRMYYFPKINMTFMADGPRHRLITWRVGKATK